MDDGVIPDSLFLEKLEKFIIKYGDELLKPCDSTEELLRKLDRFEHVLLHTPQEHKKLVEMWLQPYKEALMSNEFIRHSELDVRVSAASCIGEIIRITAPDEPYGDDHMKEFFEVVNSALERLSCMSGRTYSKAVSILRTMSTAQSCVIMLDLELYTTVHRMFHLFLDGIRTSHPNEVFSSMEKIMTMIIRNTDDNDEFLFMLFKILLSSLKKENQKASPVSFQLAENTFKNCSDDLKTHRLEAITFLDVPVEDYAEVVISFFVDGIQMDYMISASQSVHISSKEEDPPKGVSEQNIQNDIVSHPRTASGSVGEEVVGSRIKVWWPLDQMFYKGTIMGFDYENNTHQVDYDDGEIEILDLTTECWKLLKKQETGTGATPSSSKAKLNKRERNPLNEDSTKPISTRRQCSESLKRTASRSVGEEVVGQRIKVWWPLDQKFYRGTIVGFNHECKTHQVDYDDGEIETLDLTAEDWKLLKKKKKESDAAPSSSKAD